MDKIHLFSIHLSTKAAACAQHNETPNSVCVSQLIDGLIKGFGHKTNVRACENVHDMWYAQFWFVKTFLHHQLETFKIPSRHIRYTKQTEPNMYFLTDQTTDKKDSSTKQNSPFSGGINSLECVTNMLNRLISLIFWLMTKRKRMKCLNCGEIWFNLKFEVSWANDINLFTIWRAIVCKSSKCWNGNL